MRSDAPQTARPECPSVAAALCLACFALAVVWLFSSPQPGRYRWVLFSDLDGTLVHFAHDVRRVARVQPIPVPAAPITTGVQPLALWTDLATKEERPCFMVPSSTLGAAYISMRTHSLMQQLRAAGVLLVIVTGGRKSTLLARLPFLPVADVYISETGGRVLYNRDSPLLHHSLRPPQADAVPSIDRLALDEEWATRFAHVTGPLDSPRAPIARRGLLWDVFRNATELGLRPDGASYWAAFRIDPRKTGLPPGKTQQLIRTLISRLPPQVSVTENLGNFDFHPSVTGKGGVTRYLLARLGLQRGSSFAIFDDDNDLGMAAEVGQGLVVRANTKSVEEAVRAHPHWKVATKKGVLATEELLEGLLQRVTAR